MSLRGKNSVHNRHFPSVLVLSALALFWHAKASTSVKTLGYYAMTSHHYKNAKNEDADYRYKIKQHKILSGIRTYEIVKGDANLPFPQTCLSKCIAEKGCNFCGRRYCSGPYCDICNNTCWELSMKTGKLKVFFPESGYLEIKCDQEWQLIWENNSFMPPSIRKTSLKYKVQVIFSGTVGTKFAFFDAGLFDGYKLTVGQFTGGDVGNGWEAPFTGRRLTYRSNSSCLKFFHPYANCSGNGLPDYYTQRYELNRTDWEIVRGFYWRTGDELLDNTEVTGIKIWATEALAYPPTGL